MVLGSHVILSAYGFWLPNDPRGSWSEFVGAWELLRFGPATKVDTRRSVASNTHDHNARLAAKRALKYPAVRFTGVQARAIGCAFADFAAKTDLTVWACSILPEHTHLVVSRHEYPIERAINLLKGTATRRLVREGQHPMARFQGDRRRPPKVWARGHWKVFLDSQADVRRAIQYVEDNPAKEGKPPQRWHFVKPFDP